MDTRIARIAKVAKEKPGEKFTSLVHILDKQMLWDCHLEMPAKKAVGVDGVVKAAYEANLEENLEGLIQRMKRQAYKPQPSRRVYIPKDGKGMRPLGIPSYEDKVVQRAMAKILNAIYEAKFLPCSHGFRPGRSQRGALLEIDRMVMGQGVRYIVDVDIKGFFNHVSHSQLKEFLERDIVDPNFLRLIWRFLKAGILEDGGFEETEEGTPQGGIISPILGNVYLHYVLDQWFEEEIKGKLASSKACMVRFADDFVCGFHQEEEAKAFYEALVKRLGSYNLEISEEKTSIIRFGYGSEVACKQAGLKKPAGFVFLGFLHYWGKGKSGKYRLLRKTSPQKMKKRVKEFTMWAKENRHMEERSFAEGMRQKLRGHYQYYAVSDNIKALWRYRSHVLSIARKWRSRRSQKGSLTIEKFNLFLARYAMPKPRIKIVLYSFANGSLKSRMP